MYEELRRLAQHYMGGERQGHTLQPTALVHEAYLRLAEIHRIPFKDRSHFMAIAATTMRRVLVDHARARARDKRGGGVSVISLQDVAVGPPQNADLIALDHALQQLARMDPQQARIVELRFFAGLDVTETAEAMDVSESTIKRGWATAKAWLHRELNR